MQISWNAFWCSFLTERNWAKVVGIASMSLSFSSIDDGKAHWWGGSIAQFLWPQRAAMKVEGKRPPERICTLGVAISWFQCSTAWPGTCLIQHN